MRHKERKQKVRLLVITLIDPVQILTLKEVAERLKVF